MAPSSSSLPTTWINVWIGIGILGIVGMFMFPALLVVNTAREQERFVACQKGQRVDCEPSMLWKLQELNLPIKKVENISPPESQATSTATKSTREKPSR